MKAVGFIFARGGSKGLKRKNLQEIGGVSLVGRAVQHALGSQSLDRVIISSDDEEIIEEAKKYGAEFLFKRPADLASDTAKEWDAWQHAVNFLQQSGEEFDLFVSVPVTSPLRISEDVENAIKLHLKKQADITVTGSEAERNPYFNMVQDTPTGGVDLVCAGAGITRRQDAPNVYDMTTVAYVLNVGYLQSNDSIWGGKVCLSQVPKDRCADIDNAMDLACARAIYALKPEYYDTDFK